MFKQWCKQKNYSHSRAISHVLMDGGILSVPFEDLNEFYEVYVKCIKSGEKLFVVEQKTEIFNFFVDLDYQDEEALNLHEIKSIATIICEKLDSFKKDSQSIICVAEPKKKGTKIKTGVHINWPNVVVDQITAIQLMYHMIQTLNSVYSSRDWKTVIDQSVYGDPKTNSKGSGFRIPWSHKKGKHDECKGKGCVVCDNTGKLTEGEYLPIFSFENGSMCEIDQEPTVERLWQATVRTQETSINIDVPTIQEPEVTKKFRKEGDFTKTQTRNEVIDSEIVAHLQTFIRRYMTGQQDSIVLQLFKNKNFYYVKTNSKYCENLGRSHSSNHIWFSISDDCTICQKCFCRCETTDGRKFGFCKDFTGRKHKLAPKICGLLYPDKNLSKNIKKAICSYF